jgi:integrase
VLPTGGKSWRWDFRFNGTGQTVSYGKFPDLTLKAAREKHKTARELLANGINPAAKKKEDKNVARQRRTFRDFGEEWHREKVMPKSIGWQKRARYSLDLVYPHIGRKLLPEITANDIRDMLLSLRDNHTPYMAEYTRRVVALVFQFAIKSGKCEANPARAHARTIEVPKAQSYPHIALKELPTFLQAVENDPETQRETKIATLLLVRLFCRKSELINAKWIEFDLEGALWEIPGARMKNQADHLVPLARQVIELLRELRELNPSSEYLFPNRKTTKRPMSGCRLNHFISRLGYHKKLSPHGLRHVASTALNSLGFNKDHIERQLSHVDANSVRRSYNKSDYLPQRKELMQSWSDLVDGQTPASNVIPLRAA